MQSKQEFEKWIDGFNHYENAIGIIPPNSDDLYSLYCHLRVSNSIAVLEIGSGWSTTVLAKALAENQFTNHEKTASFRHPNPYALMTIDCSRKFLNYAKKGKKNLLNVK